eukprot:g10660.t1
MFPFPFLDPVASPQRTRLDLIRWHTIAGAFQSRLTRLTTHDRTCLYLQTMTMLTCVAIRSRPYSQTFLILTTRTIAVSAHDHLVSNTMRKLSRPFSPFI